MLTILHPELYRDILSFPIGVMAAPGPDEGNPLLIVKVMKEYILAGMVSGYFKVYVCPVMLNEKETVSLIFAFFDDHDEPLTIRRALVDDADSHLLISTLLSPSVRVHFFDEHGREFLVCDSELDVPRATRARLENMNWAEVGSIRELQEMHGIATVWFGLRKPKDDDEAITVSMISNPYGGSIAVQDVRTHLHQYNGAKGFSSSLLERDEPGVFQEEDIIKCLSMCFHQSQIYHGPLRATDREEICDVMVVDDDRILIIQAKDNPNTERVALQKMSRKRSAALHAFKKAVGQVRGAESYIRAGRGTLRFILNGEVHSLDIGNKKALAIVVLKEVFERDSEEYATLLKSLMIERQVPSYVISYGMLFELCYRVHDAEKFFRFSEEVAAYIKSNEDLPLVKFNS